MHGCYHACTLKINLQLSLSTYYTASSACYKCMDHFFRKSSGYVSNYSRHYPVSKNWSKSLFYAFLCPCSNWQGLAMIPCRAGCERYIDLVIGLLSLTFISRKQDMRDKFLWIALHLESFGRKVRSNSVDRAVGLGTTVAWSSFGSLFTVKDSQTRWCTLDQSKGIRSNRFRTAIFLKARTSI